MTASLADLTADQRAALDAITSWHRGGGRQPMILGGLAGSGKTSLAGLLPQVLPGVRIAFCAYTGKAASVLSRSLPDGIQASTVHRLLYRPAATAVCLSSGMTCPAGRRCAAHLRRAMACRVRERVAWVRKENPLAGSGLVVNDEASMTTQEAWEDLTRHGVPVLAIGDHGQLPPVKSSFSLMKDPHLRLEQVHRQRAGDPILVMAALARRDGRIPHGRYGPLAVKYTPEQAAAARVAPDCEAGDLMICARNATRARQNSALRAQRGRSGPPQAGDIVICLRNDWGEGLLNGERGLVLDAGDVQQRDGHEVIRIEVQLGKDRVWEGIALAEQFGSEGPCPVHPG